MRQDETRERLIEATKALLITETSPEQITARKIARKADVNLAMINYCFRSKNALVQKATEELLQEKYEWHLSTLNPDASARDNLIEMLTELTVNVLHYENIVRLSIPYLLLEGPMEMPEILLPYLKKHYEERLSEKELKTLSIAMAASLQTILYRHEEFQEWTDIQLKDSQNPKEIETFITDFVGLFLN